jgi:hypothetical protein
MFTLALYDWFFVIIDHLILIISVYRYGNRLKFDVFK